MLCGLVTTNLWAKPSAPSAKQPSKRQPRAISHAQKKRGVSKKVIHHTAPRKHSAPRAKSAHHAKRTTTKAAGRAKIANHHKKKWKTSHKWAHKKPLARKAKTGVKWGHGTGTATNYASLSASQAIQALRKRHIAFEVVRKGARGVLAPVRLRGPVHGVSWHTALPKAQRASAPWEVFDARLVLALDDFGELLQKQGIDEVIIFSAWRPPTKHWPAGKQGIRHPGAMAVDAKQFHLKSGRWIEVEDDFHGRIGDQTCGTSANAPRAKSEDALLLRSLACTAAEKRIFHSILTPNYNAPHRNHFHLEVRHGVDWFMVH
jgi:hypothetical protein